MPYYLNIRRKRKIEIAEIKSVLTTGSKKTKTEMLSHLCDVFESYNKNIPMLNEIVQFLVDMLMVSEDLEIAEEIVEAICFAQIYQNIENVHFEILEEYIQNAPEEIIPGIITILGYTHEIKYTEAIQSFRFHDNIVIRNSFWYAMRELGG